MFLLSSVAYAQMNTHMKGISNIHGRTLILNQTVTSGAAPTSVSSARVSTLRLNAAGFYSANTHVNNLPNHAYLPQIAIRSYLDSLSQSQVLLEAKQHFLPLTGAFANSFKSQLINHGVEQGWFSYNQKVFIRVNGALKEKHIVFTMSCDTVSKCLWQDPQLVDPDPVIVHVTYIPKSVAVGLPDNWSYPNAGKMLWRLVDTKFVPKTAWTTIDVAGIFDEPQQIDGSNVDEEQGLKCLIDHTKYATSGCSATYQDVAQLMNQHGAMAALVDYTRMLRPVYDTLADGSLQARIGMAVNTREVNYSGCFKGTYRNVGHYGFTLQNEMSRYWVDAERVYSKLNEFKSTSLSPTQNFDHSISVAQDRLNQIGDFVINPTAPNEALLAVSTLSNLTYLAPISYGSSPAAELAFADTVAFSDVRMELWQKYRLAVKCESASQSIIFTITASKVGGWRGMADVTTATTLIPHTWVNLNVRGHIGVGGLSAYHNPDVNKVFVRMPDEGYNYSGWLGFAVIDLLINGSNRFQLEGHYTSPIVYTKCSRWVDNNTCADALPQHPWLSAYTRTLNGFDIAAGKAFFNNTPFNFLYFFLGSPHGGFVYQNP